MNDKQLNEKDSLNLISQMIQSTKESVEVGSGNLFLIYGYTAAILSSAVYLLITLTNNHSWGYLWFLMFLPMIIIGIKDRNKKKTIVTYTEKAMNSIWLIVGGLFVLTVLTLFCIILLGGQVNFVVMLPLALIYVGIGTSITGILLKETSFIVCPILGFIVAIYMLNSYSVGGGYESIWQIYFGISFVIMQVIPGHILNHKAKKLCLKN